MTLDDEDLVRAKTNIGRVLAGKWTLEKVIGVGGMAAVYAAAHRTGSRAAVKMLHADLSRHEEVRARFLREAYIANTVGHEGVVSVIDDDIDENGCPYLVMELLTGQSIAGLLQRAGGRLPIREVLGIADQALAVLEAAHAKGIVHRDLKPDNLFMTEKGVVKMLDFGIARLRDGKTNRTKTGLLMGTPSFMAPEQALGRSSDIDGSTDQWAIGATLFNLLSGRYVHEAETDNELIIYAATRPARSLASVMPDAPPELVAVIDRSLQYDRVKRFPDVTAFREALRPFKEEHGTAKFGTVAAEAPTAGQPTGRGGRATTARRTGAPGPITGSQADPNLSLESEEAFGENVAGAKELFQRFDKSLTTKHQYGPTHPESTRRYEMLFQKASEELAKNEGGLAVNVNPYSFHVGSDTLWEPKPPLDQVPYRLFADGVRLIGFLPGLTDKELQTFIKIITSDPTKDIPPGENLLTMLWDAAFEHVVVEEVDSFTDGDQAARQRFEQDRNKIMSLARHDSSEQLRDAWKGRTRAAPQAGGSVTERKQASVLQRLNSRMASDGGDASRMATMRTFAGDRKDTAAQAPGEALRVDEATRTTLAVRFKADMGAVGERFVVASASAFLFAARQGKPQAVTSPLRLALDGLSKEAPGDAVEFVAALCRSVETPNPTETEQLRAQFAGLLISPESMKRLLEAAAKADAGQAELSKGLGMILGYLDATHLTSVLEALRVAPTTPLLDVFLKYVARVAAEREEEIGKLLAVADTDLALALLRLLAAMGTPGAKQFITLANKNPNAVVRIEAIGHLEGVSSEKLRLELRRLLEDAESGVRIAALQSMAKYKIKIAGPFLVLRVRSPVFAGLPLEERRQALVTLVELAPPRAEAVALELLQEKGGVARFVNNEGHTQTRLLAIETLAAAGSSNEAAEALTSLTRGGWLANEKVKERAMLALQSVLARGRAPARTRGGDA